MATKDMRRPDLIVPYQEPENTNDSPEMSSTISSTLPMAAMFTRNKYIGWASVVYSVQSWLGESADAKKNASTPGYLNVFMSLAAVSVSYLHLFFPTPGKAAAGVPAA